METKTQEELLFEIKHEVEKIFQEYCEYDKERTIELVDVQLYGSRMRGTNRDDSDLDVLVEYRGNLKEYAVFNLLNEDELFLHGIKLDFNPVRKEESGSIEEYLQNDERRRMQMKKTRYFLDLDGTAAVFKKIDTLERLYEKGYFLNLEPNHNVVEAVKILMNVYSDEVEVFVLSAVLSDSKYALNEKNAWIDKYLPEIDREHRIYPPCGTNKLDYIPGGVHESDLLMDDYTHNLVLWEPPARGIKLLNGINHTNATWTGNMLRYDKSPEELAKNIMDIVRGEKLIQDQRPQQANSDVIVQQLNDIRSEIVSLNDTLVDKFHIEVKKESPAISKDVNKVNTPTIQQRKPRL